MSKFQDFLQCIRPSEELRTRCQSAHERLRADVKAFEETNEVTIGQFLQGSYSRHTLIAPIVDERVDVDLMNVTKLPDTIPPAEALNRFKRMLTAMRGKEGEVWHQQDRSLMVVDADVDLDLVISSAPAKMDPTITSNAKGAEADWEAALEAAFSVNTESKVANSMLAKAGLESWKDDPLKIPDQATKNWELTHPLKQIDHHRQRQAACNGHLNDVIRALKHWKYLGRYEGTLPKRPKGYPLERMIEFHCPDGIKSVEEGVLLTMEALVQEYLPRVEAGDKALHDAGLEDNDVMKWIDPDDLLVVLRSLQGHLPKARAAVYHRLGGRHAEADAAWRTIFGSRCYPDEDEVEDSHQPAHPAAIQPRKYADPKPQRFA